MPNVVVVCSNVIADDQGRFLFVKETKPVAQGRWAFPSGRLEVGESIVEGAEREAREETGFVVEARHLLGIYHAPRTLEGGASVVFVFASEVVGGEATPSAEHPAVRFFTRSEVDKLAQQRMVRGQHLLPALDLYEQGQFLPLGLIDQVAASEPPGSDPKPIKGV